VYVGHGLKIEHYKETKKGLYRSELQKRLINKKKEEQFEWLSEVNSQSLLAVLLHCEAAYDGFFQILDD
jgi:transposase